MRRVGGGRGGAHELQIPEGSIYIDYLEFSSKEDLFLLSGLAIYAISYFYQRGLTDIILYFGL